MTAGVLIPEIGVLAPKQIIFRSSGYSPSTNNVIAFDTPTTSDFTFADIATTEAWQGVKIDIGTLRATSYAVKVRMEFFTAPTGNLIHFFWNPSEVVTAAVGNDGNASGADATYTGYNSDIEESAKHLLHLGSWKPTPNIAVQGATIGLFQPPSRYGSLVVFNESGVPIAATDDDETAVVFNPITQQGQDT